MSNKNICVLASEQDREALAPILDALREHGVKAETGRKPGKGELVLAALSGNFYADADRTRTLLELIGAEAKNVLPLQLDGEAIPQEIKNALYSRNIIPAEGRDAGQLAERIIAALPAQKSRLPLILTAAALVIAAAVGAMLWGGGDSDEKGSSGEETDIEVIAPAPEEEAVVYAGGITPEDLEKIYGLCIVGEELRVLTVEQVRKGESLSEGDFAYSVWDEGDMNCWISKEDGHEFTMTQYDLSFLPLLTNLTDLSLQMAEAEIPDLSGLKKLGSVIIQDCSISDISFLNGTSIRNVIINRCPVADYSPLSGCSRLHNAQIELGAVSGDFSGFSPSGLIDLELRGNREDADLSGLGKCKNLQHVSLAEFPATDLSFLSGNKTITRLDVMEFSQLRDVSAMSELTTMEWLRFRECERLTDLSPVGSCTALQAFSAEEVRRFTDASFLNDLPRLRSVCIYGCDLRDVDFLEGMADNTVWLSVTLGGDIRDFSGLRAIKKFDYLNLAVRNDYNQSGDCTAMLGYLEDALIQHLTLHNASRLDLSRLPKVSQSLELNDCDLRDLKGMPEFTLRELRLSNLDRLGSLEGLRNLPQFGTNGTAKLEIYGCPRLTDFSALEGVYLNELNIEGAFALPSFENIRFNSLRLKYIPELRELSLLSCKTDGWNYKDLDFTGCEDLEDLSALRRFNGDTLTVPPQMMEQAEDLQKEGAVHYVNLAYPEDDWLLNEKEIQLLSMEELGTLPKALLRRVKNLTVVGDQVVDREQYWIWDDWNHRVNGKPGVMLVDPETEKETPVKMGTIKSLDVFSELIGLEFLNLNALPIESLDGIQNMSDLRFVEIRGCSNITDFSPLFAIQQLRELRLRGSTLKSIQGVQNFWGLTALDVCNSDVTDISDLRECDFSRAYEEEGGFCLEIGDTEIDDLSPLGSIQCYSLLNVNDFESSRWMPEVEHSQIRMIYCQMDSDQDLADFVRQHPEIEELHIGGSRNVKDLTPVLELENLRYLKITGDMRAAENSLKGHNYSFELHIDR